MFENPGGPRPPCPRCRRPWTEPLKLKVAPQAYQNIASLALQDKSSSFNLSLQYTFIKKETTVYQLKIKQSIKVIS